MRKSLPNPKYSVAAARKKEVTFSAGVRGDLRRRGLNPFS